LSGLLGEHFSYSFGYTYADSQLTADVYQPAGNFYGGPLYTDRVGADGDRLPGSAEHVVTASLRHDTTFDNGVELTTVLSGYYQSEISNSLGDDVCLTEFNAIGNCRDSPNPASAFYAPLSVFSRSFAEVDGFDLWNLSMTAARDGWTGSLYVKNLFNEEGTTGVFPFLVGGSQTDPSQNYFGNNSRALIALPRTIGVTLAYRF
jgi:hypothetical protein